MPLTRFDATLIEEMKDNLENLRRDLAQILNPDLADERFAEGYLSENYESFLLTDPEQNSSFELISSFYRSIEVLQEGHPNLLSADADDLTHAYQTLLESAILFGEEVIELNG